MKKPFDLAAIDLNLLVAFKALFDQQSVTAAAAQLNIGQPAMSAALSRLRILFDDPLFIRMGRQMQPTLKAQAIAPGILSALHQLQHTLTASQAFDPATSTRSFALGSSDYTSFILMPPLLDFVSRSAPGINFQLIGYEKDSVDTLLKQGEIDLALGVFGDPSPQVHRDPLFQEEFIGIARRNHPALSQDPEDPMSLETFVQLSHALTTLRRDTVGAIDQRLDQQGVSRRIALTTSTMLVLPFTIAASDLVAAVPKRVALQLAEPCQLALFELPVAIPSWTVSMIWSTLSHQDEACCWIRQTLKTLCGEI